MYILYGDEREGAETERMVIRMTGELFSRGISVGDVFASVLRWLCYFLDQLLTFLWS